MNVPLNQLKVGATVRNRVALLPARQWKYAGECASLGGGVMPNSSFRVSEVSAVPPGWARLEIPGRSPPAFLKVSGDELGMCFDTGSVSPVTTPGASRFRPQIVESAKREGIPPSQVAEFLDFWEKSQFPVVTRFLAAIETVDSAIKVAKFFFFLRRMGFALADVAQVLTLVAGLRSPSALAMIDHVLRNGARVEVALKKSGGVRSALSMVLTAITVWNFVQKNEWSQAIATIYKTAIGIGVPWAAAIDTVQSLMPEVGEKSGTMFRVVRACDPVGLGGVGIDAIVVMAQAIVDACRGRAFNDERLAQLVARMKSGPTSLFAELGENAGDALYEISEMSADDWRLVGSYSWDQLRGLVRGS